jgi:hypothetical protein
MDVSGRVWVLLAMAACASPPPPRAIPESQLPGTDGRAHPLVDRSATLTVIEFFSAHCPCQTQHDERLRVLASAYGPRGVTFVAVDSEAGASLARDGREAAGRGYVYPILIDEEGAVARALHALYATYTLVVDREGRVLYAGGIDSDKNHLTSDPATYLRDALDDALAGRPLRQPEGKALGCALMTD